MHPEAKYGTDEFKNNPNRIFPTGLRAHHKYTTEFVRSEISWRRKDVLSYCTPSGMIDNLSRSSSPRPADPVVPLNNNSLPARFHLTTEVTGSGVQNQLQVK